MHFHRDVLAIADTFGRHVVAGRPDDVFTGTPPLAFTFGLGGLLVFPLRVGAVDPADRAGDAGRARRARRAARRRPCCSPRRPPTGRCCAPGSRQRLASVRRAVSAGEHLPEPVWQEFHDTTGIRLIDGIGTTEMLHVFISAADDDIRPGATGRAVPGYRAAVLDADGNPVPDGTPGRLAVDRARPAAATSPTRARRSTCSTAGTSPATPTCATADGYFWYQARSDDMIVSSGYNIAAPEVEQALEQHPDVVECAVVGRPDAGARASSVHAVGGAARGGRRRRRQGRELQDFAKQTIAPYKYPRSIEFVDALPRTATGKLQRFRLRERTGAVG